MSIFLIFAILMVTQIGLIFVLSQFIANSYLVELIVNIVASFIFAVLILPIDRRHFYKYEVFHKAFTGYLSVFLIFDMLFSFMGLM